VVALYVDGRNSRSPAGRASAADPLRAIETALGSAGIAVRSIRRIGYTNAKHAESGAEFAVYARCGIGRRLTWGVGIDRDVVAASFTAVRSALRRAARPPRRAARQGGFA
jgi:2-isopropylmalate synthase